MNHLESGTEVKAVGFRWNRGWSEIAIVMLWISVASAQVRDVSRINVLVYDSAKLSPSLLRRAETNAGSVFRESGIQIRWINCFKPGETDNCNRVPRADEYVLHIVPDGRTGSDLVFGEAFLGEDGTGKYSDVFFSRIVRAVDRPNVGNLLGAVAAHELGHLLLGTRSHSLVGIMKPVWANEILRKVGMGTLVFTQEQSQLMKKRLDRGGVSLALRVANRGMFEPLY